MKRAELAKELREALARVEECRAIHEVLREHNPKTASLWDLFCVARKIAAYLEDDSVDRDARRYRLLRNLVASRERYMNQEGQVTCFGLPVQSEDDLDAALDAWLEKEGADG